MARSRSNDSPTTPKRVRGPWAEGMNAKVDEEGPSSVTKDREGKSPKGKSHRSESKSPKGATKSPKPKAKGTSPKVKVSKAKASSRTQSPKATKGRPSCPVPSSSLDWPPTPFRKVSKLKKKTNGHLFHDDEAFF